MADYPKSEPNVSDSATAAFGQIFERIIDRLLRGEPVTLEQLCEEYPEHAASIRQMLPTIRTIAGMVPAELSHDLVGKRLADFAISREIGRGGMGIVYEARQVSLDRPVALKVLPATAMLDARQLARFQHEAQAAASLEHRHIVPVHAVGNEQGVHYFAMQLISGMTLSEVVKALRHEGEGDGAGGGMVHATIDELKRLYRNDRKSYHWRIAELILQAAEALHHAHQKGIIHRDVKPSNLMVDEDRTLWVTDFGLALSTDRSMTMTMTGDLVGTVRYMSPEQSQGSRDTLDHRTDVYSLGITLYELLTLKVAFEATSRPQLLRDVCETNPSRPRSTDASIPRDLETIVLKAIEKSPRSRYATAGDVADDLRCFLAHRPISARRASPWAQLSQWGQRNPALAAALSLAVALLTVVAVGGAAMSYGLASSLARETSLTDRLVAEVEETRRAQYVSEVHEASIAVRDGRYDYALELLRGHIPESAGQDDLRSIEWYLLWKQCQASIRSDRIDMQDHALSSYQLVASADRSVVALAIGNGSVEVRRTAGWQLASRIDHKELPKAIALSPRGDLLAVTQNEVVVVYGTRNGNRLHALPIPDAYAVTFVGQDQIASLVYSPSGNCTKVCLLNSGSIQQYELLTHSPVRRQTALSGSYGGRQLAVACVDRCVLLYDTSDMSSEPTVLRGSYEGDILAVCFSSSDEFLAGLGRDGHLCVWDAASYQCLRETRLSGEVSAASFSTDGSRLSMSTDRGEIFSWNWRQDDRPIRRGTVHLELVGGVVDWSRGQYDLLVSGPGRVLSVGGNVGSPNVQVLLSETVAAPVASLDNVTDIAFSPAGDRCYVAGSLFLDVYDWPSRERRVRLPIPAYSFDLDVSKDGRTVLCASAEYSFVFDTVSFEKRTLRHGGPVFEVEFVHDDQFFLTQSLSDKGVSAPRVWDAETLAEEALFDRRWLQDCYATVSRDGRFLGNYRPADIATKDGAMGSVGVLSLDQCKSLWQRSVAIDYSDHPQKLKFSPCGSWLAACSKATAHIYDSITADIKLTFTGRGIWDLRFSPHGKYVALADASAKVWLWSTEDFSAPPREMILHDGKIVFALAFSPDGNFLVSGGSDGTVRMRDLRNKEATSEWVDLEHGIPLSVIDPSDDASQIVAKRENDLLIRSNHPPGSLHVQNIETGSIVLLEGSNELTRIRSAAFHPGKHQVAVAHNGGVRLWDSHSGEQLANDVSDDYTYFLAFDNDGSHFATFERGIVAIHDADTKEQIATLSVPCGGFALSFSADDQLLAAGCWNGATYIWDVPTSTVVKEIVGQSSFPTDVQFSPDGKRLVVASATHVALWDIATGRQIASYGDNDVNQITNWSTAHVSADQTRLSLIDSKSKRRLVLHAATPAEVARDLIRLDVIRGK